MNQTMNQTTNRPTNQSTNQSTSQPINESINQLTQASCIAQLKSTQIIHPSRNGNHKPKQHNWNHQPSTLIGTVHWYVVYVPQSIDLFWRCSRQLEPTHPNLTHPVHIRTLQCLMFHVEEITCARHVPLDITSCELHGPHSTFKSTVSLVSNLTDHVWSAIRLCSPSENYTCVKNWGTLADTLDKWFSLLQTPILVSVCGFFCL